MLWSTSRASFLVRFLLSPAATVSSIAAMLLCCLWIGFSGDRTFTETVVFCVVLLYLQTVLLFVVLRGWRRKREDGTYVIRWRFLLNHCGLLIALAAAFWGAPDSETLRVSVSEGETVTEAWRMDGSHVWLPYEVTADRVSMETYEDGTPSLYEVVVDVNGEKAVITVNDPHRIRFGEDIYLTGIEPSMSRCTLQIVREPWKNFALLGIIMMFTGAFMLLFGGTSKRNRKQ